MLTRKDFTTTGFDICLLAEDEAEIEARLRAKFPNVRFVEYDYWQDEEVWRKERRTVYRQPPDLLVPYLPSLVGHERRFSTRIWLEPEGWEPDWQIWPQSGDDEGRPLWRLFNMPPSLRLLHSHPRDGNLSRGSLDASMLRGDAAHMSFVRAVGRLFKRDAITLYDMAYDDTGRTGYTGRKTGTWTLPAAKAWCEADPLHRINGCYRPAGSPGAPLPVARWSAGSCEKEPERAWNYGIIRDANARLAELNRQTAENAARRKAVKAAREAKQKA